MMKFLCLLPDLILSSWSRQPMPFLTMSTLIQWRWRPGVSSRQLGDRWRHLSHSDAWLQCRQDVVHSDTLPAGYCIIACRLLSTTVWHGSFLTMLLLFWVIWHCWSVVKKGIWSVRNKHFCSGNLVFWRVCRHVLCRPWKVKNYLS